MRLHHAFSFLLIVSIFSCDSSSSKSNQEQPIEQKPLALVDKGLKVFPLDNETDFQGIREASIYLENEKEYFHFYNNPNHSIYIYDYDSAQIARKITLEKEGPNGVPQFIFSKYLIQNFDSVFVQIPFYGMYLVSGEAEILNRIVPASENFTEQRQAPINNVSIDAATRFQNHQLGVAYSSQVHEPNKPYARTLINFEDNSISEGFIRPESFVANYNEIEKIRTEKGKTFSDFDKQFVANKAYLFATSPISDSLYLFKEGALVKRIYFGLPSETLTDYKNYMALREMIISTNGSSGSVMPVVNHDQPPFFTNLFISPNGKYIYRILSHGTKPAVNPNTNIEYTTISKATLLVMDLEKEEMASFELPIDELKMSVPKSQGIFASNTGLHIQLKGQENENEIQFRVFGVQ